MYHKLEDFINDWTIESESTLKVFNKLTDESLTKKVDDNVRTAGRLAWHITTSIGEMAHRTGLTFKTVEANSAIPATAKEIVDAYKEASENLLAAIKSSWNDDTLSVEDDMYGEMWKRVSNEKFVANASPEIVEKERAKQKDWSENIIKLKEILNNLN